MLIFFIVTTTFVKATGVTVNVPNAQSASNEQGANIFVAIAQSIFDSRQNWRSATALHAQNRVPLHGFYTVWTMPDRLQHALFCLRRPPRSVMTVWLQIREIGTVHYTQLYAGSA